MAFQIMKPRGTRTPRATTTSGVALSITKAERGEKGDVNVVFYEDTMRRYRLAVGDRAKIAYDPDEGKLVVVVMPQGRVSKRDGYKLSARTGNVPAKDGDAVTSTVRFSADIILDEDVEAAKVFQCDIEDVRVEEGLDVGEGPSPSWMTPIVFDLRKSA